MKKTVKIVSLLLTVCMLSGCMKLDVDCGINSDYTAYLNYTMEMDISTLDSDVKSEITEYFEDFISDYEEYGFVSINRSGEGVIDITLTYEKYASSYEEAYDNLKSILNDPKVSFLLSTDMTTAVQEYEQAFTINAKTDVTEILGTSHLDSLPQNINSMIRDGLKKSEINFSFTLPQSTVTETNGNVKNESGNTTITFPVSLSEASEFSVVVRMSLDDNTAVNEDIDSLVKANEQTISLYKTLLPIISILAGCVAIALVYSIIKQRKNKQLQQSPIE